jgi:hypothetical protein
MDAPIGAEPVADVIGPTELVAARSAEQGIDGWIRANGVASVVDTGSSPVAGADRVEAVLANRAGHSTQTAVVVVASEVHARQAGVDRTELGACAANASRVAPAAGNASRAGRARRTAGRLRRRRVLDIATAGEATHGACQEGSEHDQAPVAHWQVPVPASFAEQTPESQTLPQALQLNGSRVRSVQLPPQQVSSPGGASDTQSRQRGPTAQGSPPSMRLVRSMQTIPASVAH